MSAVTAAPSTGAALSSTEVVALRDQHHSSSAADTVLTDNDFSENKELLPAGAFFLLVNEGHLVHWYQRVHEQRPQQNVHRGG